MDYKIFQLKEEFLFGFGFRNLSDGTNSVDLDRYHCVYTGKIAADGKDIKSVLEELFEIFNINHPEDFMGYSLSVSDIVMLGEKYYYCCNMGWTEVQIS